MVLPAAREGSNLWVRSRQLEFSFFMMRRGKRRWGVNTMLYAAEPWAIIEGGVSTALSPGPTRRAAQSFARQANEYFVAAERAGAFEARPLLNLAKALTLTRGRHTVIGKVTHGVAHQNPSGHTVPTAEIQFQKSGPGSPTVVDEVYQALHGTHVPFTKVAIAEVVPQSVVAHRLWREAANRRERFLTVEGVAINHGQTARQLWATLTVRADTMRARSRGVGEVVTEGALAPSFRAVSDVQAPDGALRRFEQVSPTGYGSGRPSDKVVDVVDLLRPLLWQTVTSAPPYRRYYLYLSPQGEVRLPQWLSIYALFFWLGSLTRYQPVELLEILDGPYGAFFREFLATQPSQLLYLWASEFKRQDVARAAVV
jgi:hypothetical protein